MPKQAPNELTDTEAKQLLIVEAGCLALGARVSLMMAWGASTRVTQQQEIQLIIDRMDDLMDRIHNLLPEPITKALDLRKSGAPRSGTPQVSNTQPSPALTQD
jgi:hypothetical protein